MAFASQPLITADEYLALPPTEWHDQLIDGVIVVTDSRLRHQLLVGELYRLLANWTVEHPGTGQAGIGCNWRMDDRNVFVPDVWWMSEARRLREDRVWIDGPPDLVIEVRSPSTWRFDVGRKKELYLASGFTELWLVDTVADNVQVLRGDEAFEVGAGGLLATPLVDGFSIDVARLFDR